jgi:hypothetical protein
VSPDPDAESVVPDPEQPASDSRAARGKARSVRRTWQP